MSRTIDERVVEMKFDNSDFEKNVKQSMNTLDDLKKNLNMDGTSKGLNKLADAAKGVSFDKLGDAVDTVKSKFSALEIVGITALVNITNKAVDAGLSLAKSLSVDQIASGWSKYAEKTQAIQTILSAVSQSGMDIDDVTERIKKLNWYTDETSYSLTDMTNNIGKFTANGVDLDSATTAMIGISNWAALSGQHIQEASRAMYNLSQALGTGSVQVRDWMSIENANMATQEFKNLVIQVAKTKGTINDLGQVIDQTTKKAKEDVVVTAQTFRETLRYDWFNKDVLIDTLKIYGDLAEKVNILYEAFDGERTTSTILNDIEEIRNGNQDIINQYDASLIPLLNELADSVGSVGWRAFKAAQEATTFQQAIDSIKDAASTKWSSIFETLFGNYDEARHLWTDLANDLYTVFAEPLDNLLSDLEYAFSSPFEQSLKGAGISASKFKDIFGDVVDSSGKKISELVTETGNFEEALRDAVSTGKVGTLELQTAMAKYIQYIGTASDDASNNVTASLDEIKKAVWDVGAGLYGSGGSRIKALTEKFGEGSAEIIQEALARTFSRMQGNYTYEAYSKYFDEVCADMIESLSGLSNAQLEQANYTEEEIEQIKTLSAQFKEGAITAEELVEALAQPSGKWLFTDSLRNMMGSFLNVLGAVREAWNNVFNPEDEDGITQRAKNIKSLIVSFHDFSTNLRSFTEGTAPTVISILSTVFSAIQKVGSAIGTIISKVWNFTKTLLTPLMSHLGELVTIIGTGLATAISWVDERAANLWNNIKSSDFYLNISKWIDGIKEKLKSLEFGSLEANLTAIQSYADKAAEKVDGFFNNLFKGSEEGKEVPTFLESIGGSFLGIKNKITGWVDELSNYLTTHGKIDTFVDQIVGSLQFLKEKISDYVHIKIFGDDPLTSISDGLQRFWKWINGWNISQKITAKLENIGIGFVNWGVEIENIWLHKIKPVLKSIADYFKDENNQIDFDKIINVAKAGVLLTFILSLSNFLNAAARLRRKIGSVFTAIADRIRGGSSRLTLAFKDMAVAIGIITACVLALAELEGRNEGELAKKAIKDIEIIIWSMVGAFAAMKVLEALLSGGAGGITATLKQFRIGISPLAEAILAVVGLAGSLYLVAAALEKLKDFNWNRDKDAVKALLAIMAVMIAGLAALKRVPGEMGFGTIAFMAIVVALNMLLPVIEKFNDFPWAKMTKGIATVIIALGIIAVIFRTMSAKLPANSKSTGVLGIAVALGVLIYSLKYLLPIIEQYNDMEWDTFRKGFGKIAIMLGVLVGAIILLEKSLKDVKGLSVLGIAATLAVLIGGIAILGNMETRKLTKGVISLMAILISLGGCLALASKMSSGIGLISIAVLAAICAGLVYAIKYLTDSNVPWQMAVGITGGISAVLLAIGKCIKDLTIAVAAGGFLGALSGIGILLIAIVALVTIGAAITWAAGFLNLENGTGFEKGLDNLIIIAGKIGEAIGAFAGGTLIGLSASLIDTAYNLTNFLYAMEPFLDGLDIIEESHIEKVNLLKRILSGLIGEEFKHNLASLGGLIDGSNGSGGLTGLADQLSRFSFKIRPFFNYIKVVDESVLTKTNTLVEIIRAVNQIPKRLDYSYIDEYSAHLPGLAETFKTYADNLSGIDEEVAKQTSIMTESLASILSVNIPASGGLWDKIVGSEGKGLESYGTGIKSLAEHFKIYCNTIKDADIPSDIIDKTQKMCESIALIIGTGIPRSGGNGGSVVDIWAGNASQGLVDYGEAIINLAESFKGYSEVMNFAPASGLVDNTKTMVECIKEILTAEIPSSGGWVQDIFGGKDYGSFGDNLKTLGKAMSSYGSYVKGLPDNLVDKSNTLVEAMNVLAKLESAGPAVSLNNYENNMGTLGGGAAQGYVSTLSGISDEIKSFVEKVSAIDFSSVVSTSDQLNSFGASIQSFSGSIATEFSSSLSSISSSISTFISDVSSLGSIDFSSIIEKFKTFGTDIGKSVTTSLGEVDPTEQITAFINSIESALKSSQNLSKVSKGANEVANRIKLAFSSLKARAFTTGANITQGLINGLNSKTSDLYTIAYNIGVRVAQSVKDGAQVMSPSKATYEVGKYLDEGLILGMKALQSNVYKEGTEVGQASVDAFNTAMKTMTDSINAETEIDYNPVITPVLDLSQIQNGVNTIDGMFANPKLSIDGTANLVRQVGLSVPTSNSRSYSSSSVNNLYIDGIKYNSDEYVDKSINDFVVSMIRKART